MDLLGNLVLRGLGFVKNLRIENLAADPVTPSTGQLWYNTTDGEFRVYDGTTVKTISLGGDSAAIQAELDATQVGAGLGADGSYTKFTDSNYINDATSLTNADKLLDTQLKTTDADLRALVISAASTAQELNSVETGAGLSNTGTYVVPTGTNYLDASTSLANADSLLDTAVKSAADAAAAAATKADGAVERTGDTMEGNLAFGGTHKITGLADGTTATDAVNKGQLDAALAGLDFQPDVWGVQTDATLVPEETLGRRYIITNAAALNAGFGTIDGVANGDIVEYDGADFQVVYDVSTAGPGAIAWNRGDNQFWYYGATSWSAFGGMSGVEAGVGLKKTGNVLSVELGAGIGQLPTNEVGLDVLPAGGLFLTENGTAASTGTDAKLALLLDGTTLARSATGVKIADAGVGAAQIAAAALGNGLVGGAGTVLSVEAKPDGGIIVDEDGLSIDPSVLEFLPLAGGELTGPLLLAADPTDNLGAATKQYVDAKAAGMGGTFNYDGVTSSTTHVVQHNIGSKYCVVTVVDSADKVIIPDSITFDDENNLTVGFASAITCKVVVVGKYVAPAPQQ